MATQIVGYKLVDEQGAIHGEWGGVIWHCPDIPNPLKLPNGDVVHAAAVGETYSGYTLMAWLMNDGEE